MDILEKTYNVLIVGCGDIGSRHLQAVSRIPAVGRIDVVDSRPAALESAHARLREVERKQNSPDIRWLNAIGDGTSEVDLCVVATQAAARPRIVREVAERTGCQTFLLEKVVAQSVPLYEELLGFSKERKLSVWVNCPERTYGVHARAKSQLDPREPIFFTVFAGNRGLATNGTHSADLFAFYDDAVRIDLVNADIDPCLHASRRSSDLHELSGTLYGRTDKGSRLVLSYNGLGDGPIQVSVIGKDYRCVMDHRTKWAVESRAADGWTWRPVPFDENILISHLSGKFISEILATGRCALPTLEQCFTGHRFILDSLQPCFSKLMGMTLDYCPVT